MQDEVLNDRPGRPLSRLGPYRLLRKLGSGAMGVVWLAEEDGERFALKVLHPELIERQGLFRRFQQEAWAGHRVEHPGVVRTLHSDLYLDGETPLCFLVMEYVSGRTLRELMEDLGVVPEALLREIAVQAAAGLAAIHAAGIVHRDLKPENLMITDDLRVRIMDLGLAWLSQDPRVTPGEAVFAGSLPYAAPEQIRGETIGFPADLYSLGVTLYELATGTNPFRHPDRAEMRDAHLRCTPPTVRTMRPEVSAFFSELIGALIVKDPRGRLRSAADLARMVTDGEDSLWWREREKERAAPGARPAQLPVRRETPLFGREEELEALEEALALAAAGEGQVVVVRGEAGIGKSRLLDTFLAGLGGREALVLIGSYSPGSSMGGLAASILECFGATGLREALIPHVGAMGTLLPAFVAAIRNEAPPPGDRPLDRKALHSVFVELLRGMTGMQPVVWIVDNLDYADADQLGLFAALARVAAHCRVLLVGTCRPQPAGGPAGELDRIPGVRLLEIGRLPPLDVHRCLRALLQNDGLAERLRKEVSESSDGIPFFVLELVRALRDEGYLVRQADGTWVQGRPLRPIPVPRSIQDLVAERLGGLGRSDRELLEAAAVTGFEFDPEVLARALDRDRLGVLQDLAALERGTEVLVSVGRRYRFDHHQLREVIVAGMAPPLTRKLHTRLARAFAEQVGVAAEGGEGGEDAAFFVRHHLAGEHPEEGLPLLEQALDHLERRLRPQEALELTRQALAFQAMPDRRRLEVLDRRIGLLHNLGRREEEAAELEEARTIAGRVGDSTLSARVHHHAGQLCLSLGHHAEARDRFQEALDLALAGDDQRSEVLARTLLGRSLQLLGERAMALAELECAERRAEEVGQGKLLATALRTTGILLHQLARGEESLVRLNRAVVLSEEAGDPSGVATGHACLGYVLLETGRLEEAREHLERGLALYLANGDRESECHTLGSLGGVHRSLAQLEQAEEIFIRQFRLARDLGNPVLEGWAVGNLGIILTALGRHAEAREHYELQAALHDRAGNVQGAVKARGDAGISNHRLGRLGAAREMLEASVKGHREWGVARIEAIYGIFLGALLTSLGDLEAAEERLTASRDAIRELGDLLFLGGCMTELGRVRQLRGDLAGARRCCAEGKRLNLEFDQGIYAGFALLGEARTWLDEDPGEARRLFREALEVSTGPGEPDGVVLSHAYLALLGEEPPRSAVELLREHSDRMSHEGMMEALQVLGTVTGDRELLASARHCLDELLAHAPPERREAMRTRIPLHREILAGVDADE